MRKENRRIDISLFANDLILVRSSKKLRELRQQIIVSKSKCLTLFNYKKFNYNINNLNALR